MEKLSSSDLMIGNYLQKDGIIHQILSISGSINDPKKGIKKAANIRTDKSTEYMFLDHFEPILLTDKILSKLNLYKLNKSYGHTEVPEYSIVKEASNYVILNENGIYEYPTRIREIKYIHSLQNIYNVNKSIILKLKR